MTETNGTSTTTNPDGQAAGQAAVQQTTPVVNPDSAGAKIFTQDDLNQKAAERAQRAAEKVLSDLLGEAGVSTKEDLLKRLNRLKEREDAEKTVADKLAEQLKVEQDRKAELLKQIEEMKAQRINDVRDAAIREAAQSEGALDALDIIDNLKRKGLLEKFVDAEGKVDAVAVKTAVTALRTEKPQLFSAQVPSVPSNRGGSAPAPDKAKLEKYKQDAINTHRRIIQG